jgi:hypothetical protein
MTYSAKTALPFPDSHRAVAALRGQLRLTAMQHEAIPDWSTLRVAGPDEVIGQHGRVWYEWTATVVAAGSDVHAE